MSLDLFDTKFQIAHDSEEEEEQEDKGEYQTVKVDFWEILKYLLLFVGGGLVIHKIMTPGKKDDLGSNEMMMMMLFLIYQSNMQIMSGLSSKPAATGGLSPAQPVAAPIEGDRDWVAFFNENKNKILDQDKLMKLDELGVKENWRVERDFHGNVLNVFKVNEYVS